MDVPLADTVRQFLSSGDNNQTVSDDGRFRKLFIRAIQGEERADANGDGYPPSSESVLWQPFLRTFQVNSCEARESPYPNSG